MNKGATGRVFEIKEKEILNGVKLISQEAFFHNAKIKSSVKNYIKVLKQMKENNFIFAQQCQADGHTILKMQKTTTHVGDLIKKR